MSDEQVLFLTDIPADRLRDRRAQRRRTRKGDTVAVIGVGHGRARGPRHDRPGERRVEDHRRPDRASSDLSKLPASSERPTPSTAGSGQDTVEQLKALTDDGLGVDVAIEAVGVPGVADHRRMNAGPARRDDREHRGARVPGGATHPEPVDPQHHPGAPGWSTRSRSPRCSRWWRAGGSRPRRWAPTRSRSARSTRPTTCSRTPRPTRR